MVTYLENLRDGLHKAFANDERTHFLGEDVLDPYGGAFKVSKGLSDAYPTRVHTTPISEGAIVGTAIGMAVRGLRPVVELMFGDFLTLTTDQLVNHAAKLRAMYNGKVEVPLVVRTPMGAGRGYGPTHSQTLEKILLGTPHLDVVAPSHFHSPGDSLRKAIEMTRPTLFIENKLLYPTTLVGEPGDGQLHVDHLNAATDHDVARVRNFAQGQPDATIVAYGGMSVPVADAVRRLADEEVRVEAYFPSVISKDASELFASSFSLEAPVLIVDEGVEGFGWASEMAANLNERLWGRLPSPVRRLTSLPTVVPTTRSLENHVMPTSRKIEDAILEMMS